MATNQNYCVVPKGTKQFLLYLEQWLMAEKCASSASKCKLDGVVCGKHLELFLGMDSGLLLELLWVY